ncbi:UNVERIFIED_CONTAM: putative disease resistance protein [Sesamum calycinum]|uniref:Disease resistance protein n=1 Tax=Sesamum calycinum TaxID=2727403 RepID=A0AAW2J0U6_9LAMI
MTICKVALMRERDIDLSWCWLLSHYQRGSRTEHRRLGASSWKRARSLTSNEYHRLAAQMGASSVLAHADGVPTNPARKQFEELARPQTLALARALRDASLRSIRSQRSNYSLGWWADVNGAAEKYEEEEDHKDEEEENGLDLNPSVDVVESLREASLLRERLEQSKLMYSYSYDEEKLSIVGYERKTMLARAVYGNRIVKNWFKGSCAWISGKVLKMYIPDEQNGSKIIITTWDEQLGRLADPERQPHSLKKLDYKESWDLFLRKVGLKEGPDNSTLKDRIIKVCRGIPLNIVLLGSLLSTKKDRGINEWLSILDNHENWSTSDILMFSYSDLDAHLQLCLLYMMLFPKELDIPVRRLQRLWLAEGFVKRPENNDIFLEDVVQGYFDDLVKRSLISVSKLRSNGSPRKCRLLGVLHDLLLTKARGISLFHIHQGSVCNEDGPFGKRRLVEYADGNNCSLTPSEYKCLRSYISFNFQKKDTPAKDVAKLLSHMIGKGLGLLRVLDLEGVYKPSLPDNLGDLFHLRYLGLRWTFLDKLPKSVGELSYLETLDLKHTYINGIPHSIWKLKHLRHLSLNEIHLNKDMPLHSHTGSLPKLLTLWGLSVDQDSPIKNGLSKLTDLRELGITFRLSKCDDKDSNGFSTAPQFMQDLVEWISKLTNLQSLRLRSKDDSGRPADLSLKPFSSLNKLSHMNLLGRLQKLPEIDHFPPNIKVLTLSVSQLDEDPMPVLGQLQSLTVLRLFANSYLGEKIVCPPGTFKGLEVLKLWMLKDLKNWELEEGAMKKLKELNIRCCSKLENIPSRLLQQGTFKDLILTNMSEKFKQPVETNNPRKVSITVKDYRFTPLPVSSTPLLSADSQFYFVSNFLYFYIDYGSGNKLMMVLKNGTAGEDNDEANREA